MNDVESAKSLKMQKRFSICQVGHKHFECVDDAYFQV